MSSIVKDILIRSTTNDVYARKIIKERFGDQIEQLRAHPRPTRGSRRSQATRCHGSRIEPSGFAKPEPKTRSRPQALLTPVSDHPTPITNKVRYTYISRI